MYRYFRAPSCSLCYSLKIFAQNFRSKLFAQMFYASLLAVIVSNVLYHTAQKSTPQTAHPLVSTMISYAVAMGICAALYWLLPERPPFAEAVRGLNWASYALGLSIVGVELGYLFVYKSGWNLSLASLVAGVCIALLLVPIGLIWFREQLSWRVVVGMVLCMVGLVLITKR
jgi:drug/metabolite transporter (DMT)-like permease